MTFKLETVDAAASAPSGWRSHKIKTICGECSNLWTATEFVTITNRGGRMAVRCPECKRWNLTDVVPNA